MSYAVTPSGAAAFVRICGTWRPLTGSTVSIGAKTKLPSGVRSEDGESVMPFPGWPLKSFDCFASTPQVALDGLLVEHRALVVAVTSAETRPPLPSAVELDFARNWTTLPAMVTLKPLLEMLVTVPRVRPAGAVKFADPSDCCAFGSFVSVSVKLPGVFSVRWTFATYGFELAAWAEPMITAKIAEHEHDAAAPQNARPESQCCRVAP